MTIIPKPNRTGSIQRRLAKGICARLRLPDDDVLAHVIGNGTEATSEAAVATWLNASGFDPQETSLLDACNALQRDLTDRLDV